MKAGRSSNYRLDQVAELDSLRGKAGNDPAADAKVVSLCRQGMLVCGWERGEPRRRTTPPEPKATTSATRFAVREQQIARALSPAERAMFEHCRDAEEREDGKSGKKRKAAA